jgi:hypothetical protein
MPLPTSTPQRDLSSFSNASSLPFCRPAWARAWRCEGGGGSGVSRRAVGVPCSRRRAGRKRTRRAAQRAQPQPGGPKSHNRCPPASARPPPQSAHLLARHHGVLQAVVVAAGVLLVDEAWGGGGRGRRRAGSESAAPAAHAAKAASQAGARPRAFVQGACGAGGPPQTGGGAPHPSSSKFLIWPPKRVGNSDASKRSMLLMPLSPASSLGGGSGAGAWVGAAWAGGASARTGVDHGGAAPPRRARAVARRGAAAGRPNCALRRGAPRMRGAGAPGRGGARRGAALRRRAPPPARRRGACGARAAARPAASAVFPPFPPVVEGVGVVAEHGAAADARDHHALAGIARLGRGGAHHDGVCAIGAPGGGSGGGPRRRGPLRYAATPGSPHCLRAARRVGSALTQARGARRPGRKGPRLAAQDLRRHGAAVRGGGVGRAPRSCHSNKSEGVARAGGAVVLTQHGRPLGGRPRSEIVAPPPVAPAARGAANGLAWRPRGAGGRAGARGGGRRGGAHEPASRAPHARCPACRGESGVAARAERAASRAAATGAELSPDAGRAGAAPAPPTHRLGAAFDRALTGARAAAAAAAPPRAARRRARGRLAPGPGWRPARRGCRGAARGPPSGPAAACGRAAALPIGCASPAGRAIRHGRVAPHDFGGGARGRRRGGGGAGARGVVGVGGGARTPIPPLPRPRTPAAPPVTAPPPALQARV